MIENRKSSPMRKSPEGIAFGAKVKAAREAAGMTLHDLARAAGVTHGGAYKWEWGRLPGAEMIEVLYKVLPGLADDEARAVVEASRARAEGAAPAAGFVGRKAFGRLLRKARRSIKEGSEYTAKRAGLPWRNYVRIEQGLVTPLPAQVAALRALFPSLPAQVIGASEEKAALKGTGAPTRRRRRAPQGAPRRVRWTFAWALRRAREEAKLLPPEVADRINVELSCYYRWERGETLPGHESRAGLLAVLPALSGALAALPPPRVRPKAAAPVAAPQAPPAAPSPVAPTATPPVEGGIRGWLRAAAEVRRSFAQRDVLALLEFAKSAGLGLDDVIEAVRS